MDNDHLGAEFYERSINCEESQELVSRLPDTELSATMDRVTTLKNSGQSQNPSSCPESPILPSLSWKLLGNIFQ